MKASPEEIATYERLALERGGSVSRATSLDDGRHRATGTATYTEQHFTDDVIEFARKHGWRVAHFRPGRTAKGWRTAVQGDGKGWPDLVAIRGRVMIVAELKAGKNKTTAEQEAWLACFRELAVGCDRIEVFEWREHDWPEIERTFR